MDNLTNYENVFSSLAGGILVLYVFLVVIIIAFAIVAVIANWKMYKKAGKQGWECIVPVYGYWVLAEIAGLEWWWFLLAIADSITSIIGLEDLSSIANILSLFASFNIYYNIAKKFGKDKGNAILAGIFSGIFVLIFGFSKKEVYNASIPVSKNGIFGTPEGNYNSNNNNNSNQFNNGQTTDNTNNFNSNPQNNTTQTTENVNVNNVVQDNYFCGNCGTKLEKDIRFCPNCGKEKN